MVCDVVRLMLWELTGEHQVQHGRKQSSPTRSASDLLGGTMRNLRVEIVVCMHRDNDNAAIVNARFANIDHLATSGPKGDEGFVYARCAAHSECADGCKAGEAREVYECTLQHFAE